MTLAVNTAQSELAGCWQGMPLCPFSAQHTANSSFVFLELSWIPLNIFNPLLIDSIVDHTVYPSSTLCRLNSSTTRKSGDWSAMRLISNNVIFEPRMSGSKVLLTSPHLCLFPTYAFGPLLPIGPVKGYYGHQDCNWASLHPLLSPPSSY